MTTTNLVQQYKIEFAKTRKSLGQHFLINPFVVGKIAETAISYSTNIVEIGPGCGVLTRALLDCNANVVAIEIDPLAMDFLQRHLQQYTNLTILHDDALEVDLTPVLQAFTPKNTTPDLKSQPCLVSNLPYNISTKIYTRLTSLYGHMFQSAVLMFQKEVAQRLTAMPNSKNYSSLSVFTQYYYHVRKVVDVSGSQFWPKANVLSTVLVFERKATLPLNRGDEAAFFNLVRTCFTQKRKTLRNNLKGSMIGSEKLSEILKHLDLSESVRAEQLTLDNFIHLFNHKG